MKPYNGHRSWNAWNVSLWIANEEPLYRSACDIVQRVVKLKGKSYNLAARLFIEQTGLTRTPDGAKYNRLAVKLALEGLEL